MVTSGLPLSGSGIPWPVVALLVGTTKLPELKTPGAAFEEPAFRGVDSLCAGLKEDAVALVTNLGKDRRRGLGRIGLERKSGLRARPVSGGVGLDERALEMVRRVVDLRAIDHATPVDGETDRGRD